MIHIMLAEGFEEIEALTVVDILRRCGLEVCTTSITEDRLVAGAHGINVMADSTLNQENLEESLCVVLPGGMPGASNLLKCKDLCLALCTRHERSQLIAAICAAPIVLGMNGLLKGFRATCYPGFETRLEGAEVCENAVETDRHIITGKGPGVAAEFAFAIATQFCPKDVVGQVRNSMFF